MAVVHQNEKRWQAICVKVCMHTCMHVTMEAIFWFCWFDLGIQQTFLCTFVDEWSGKEKGEGVWLDIASWRLFILSYFDDQQLHQRNCFMFMWLSWMFRMMTSSPVPSCITESLHSMPSRSREVLVMLQATTRDQLLRGPYLEKKCMSLRYEWALCGIRMLFYLGRRAVKDILV